MRRGPSLRRCAAAACLGLVAVLVAATPAQAKTVREAQWYLDALHVPQAHKITRGEGVIVGVVDSTGVDGSHPDLAGQVLPGAGFGPGAASNGWSTSAEAGHATGMAGIIAAKGGGPEHALGIAPGAKILPVGVGGGEKTMAASDVAAAIRWAADHGAKVLNISIAGDGPAPDDEVAAVRYALSRDVVVVAGAGNAENNNIVVGAPASIPGVVAVSGVKSDGGFWSGSASGNEVTIGAPAVNIISTTTKAAYHTTYRTGTGTSDSTAIVSGTAALIRAKYPNLNAASVINRLIMTAKDQPPTGRDKWTGYGTVRVVDALTKPVPEVKDNPLGEPKVSESPSSSEQAAPGGSSSSRGWLLVVGGVVLGLILLVVLIVVVVVLANRGKRRSAPRPGYPPQPGGFQPPAGAHRPIGYPPTSTGPPPGGYHPPPGGYQPPGAAPPGGYYGPPGQHPTAPGGG